MFYEKRLLLSYFQCKDNTSINVTQYHFIEWPDHGVPADKICMLSMIEKIRQSHSHDGPPLVVHCSAGVGRTGTFIVLDAMMDRMKSHSVLDIPQYLSKIRQQRMKLVQNEVFMYEMSINHICYHLESIYLYIWFTGWVYTVWEYVFPHSKELQLYPRIKGNKRQ